MVKMNVKDYFFFQKSIENKANGINLLPFT